MEPLIQRAAFCLLCLLISPRLRAQDSTPADPSASSPTQAALPDPSVAEKWHLFTGETVTPLIAVMVIPDATISQLTRAAPLYGKHFWRRDAFAKRAGATLGDDISQNFFSDFLFASAFHENTRYVPIGPGKKGVWTRIGYALSRGVVTRTDEGKPTFNWANVAGCAMSAGLSNAYYPPVSRTPSDTMVNWWTNVAEAGLSNLLPEFGPEVGHWFKRHLLPH